MMFRKEYKGAYLLVFLLITVGSLVKAASPTQSVITDSSSMLGPISGVISPSRVGSTNSVGSTNGVVGHSMPTKVGTEPNEEEKLAVWVIIVIAASSAIFLIALVILLLLCIFRRRRIQRLERERNLSYNNMNYESTVKFRQENADGTTLGSDPGTTSPRKTNNNALRDAGYERVDLPSDKKPLNRPYENVTPENVKDGPNQQYENVTPMVSSANDKSKAPAGRYEEVFLKNGDKEKRNDKYYENVELNI